MSVKMAEGQGVRTVIWIGTEECNHAAIELGVERQAPCPHGSIVHDQSYLDLRVQPDSALSRDEWAGFDAVRWQPGAAANSSSRARRRELTRAGIIDASTRLFVRNGYEQTTLGRVAEAVGISVPTLLTHFPTKEHLVLAREYGILAAFERTIADPARGADTLTLWNDLVVIYVEGKLGPLDAFGRRLQLMAGTPAVSRALLGLAQAYADVLEAGFRADLGRLVSHVEARLGARLAATGLAFGHFAMLTQWAAEGAPGDLQQRSDQLVRDIRGQLPTAVLSS